MKLLAIDIGNTNINSGVFDKDKLLKKYVIPTNKKDYSSGLKNVFAKSDIDNVIVCSVVPDATSKIKKALKPFCKNIFIVGKDIKVLIKNLYRNPKQVGQDRLVNAYAGVILYGAPLIVVDFGTAITFDVISKNKEYLGGMILPGVGISLDALAKKTALLPKVKLRAPKELIGRDTKSSILSGVVFGFALTADGLACKIKDKIGRSAKFIGTGGNISFISKYCRSLDKIDPDLTLKGLNFIYKNTCKNLEA